MRKKKKKEKQREKTMKNKEKRKEEKRDMKAINCNIESQAKDTLILLIHRFIFVSSPI